MHIAGDVDNVPVVRLDSVDSTNSEAKRQAALGANRVWVIANQQTQGRGRRARAWVSRPGNLYTSHLLHPSCAAARLGDYAFVAGIALHDAVTQVAPALGGHVWLKWPNDLVSDAGKLSGILLESETASESGEGFLVIGWGVNCAHHPQGNDYPATDLEALGARIEPAILFDALRHVFAHWDLQLRTHGFSVVREAWIERARGINAPITVRLDGTTISGMFSGLDEHGRLILTQDDESVIHITAGDVFFPEHNHMADDD